VAGRNYGTGSSRDDAAKSTRYLGVVAVIAESFERIHRSNLLAMGVLPLAFATGTTRRSLGWTGAEGLELDLRGLDSAAHPVPCRVNGHDGPLLSARIETAEELAFWRAGGLMPYLTRRAEATIRR
jgi:aconitate hydratase